MMNYFDILAPIYEKFHRGARKTFDKINAIEHFEKQDEVIDLGGGTGRIAKFFVGVVKKVTVVDPSKKMIE